MNAAAPDVLVVHGAQKRFGSTMALDGASFALREGELLALLGPNGAGKTTLIRAISGRVALDAGEISLFGRSIAAGGSTGQTSPDLGIVPQDIAVYPLLSPRENLEAFGRMQGLRGRDLADRVAWALSLASLGDRAKEIVKGFSGGMKRRLNIACGVLHRPRIVLLDEPTVGVDPQSRERINDMLEALTHDGVSLLLTTHHLEEAEARCARTVIIDHGRVIAEGTLPELVDRTVGRHRVVIVRTGAPVTPVPSGLEALPEEPRTLRARVTDVARELPGLIATVAATGTSIEDVEVKAPSLQSVFIHLTGRELRE